MGMFRKKPITVEAIIFDGSRESAREAKEFCIRKTGGSSVFFRFRDSDQYYISTLEGAMRVMPGDYIIRGIRGEYYPCKPDIFVETYEPVNPVETDDEC